VTEHYFVKTYRRAKTFMVRLRQDETEISFKCLTLQDTGMNKA